MSRSSKNTRARWKKWVLLVASAALCVILLEVVCRAFIEGALVHTIEVLGGESRIQPDETVGFKMRPGVSDGIHINSLGLRGAEVTREKLAGCRRILMIGGSTTFGNSVGDAETYPHQVEQILRSRSPEQRIEVINAGISGARSYHHLLRLKHSYLSLDPDVVTFYTGWNDYGTYVWAMDHWDPTSLSTQTLVVDASDLEMAVLERSSLYRVSYTLWKSMVFKRNVERISGSEHPEKALQGATDALRDNLRESIDLCRDRGIEVALIEFPWILDNEDVEGDLRRLNAMHLENDMRRHLVLVQAFATVPRLVFGIYEELARTDGVTIIDCAAPFEAMPLSERLSLFDDPIHPNAAGYRRIAECLASRLAE